MSSSRMIKPEVKLADVLPPDHFRTVDSPKCLKAPSEIPVEMIVKDNFRKKLSFPIPWDGEIYAFARMTPEFLSLTGKTDISQIGKIKAYLNDWDDKFALGFTETREKIGDIEISYFTSYEDVLHILENCCRIPEQKGKLFI